MKCEFCGNLIQENTNSCPYCGSTVRKNIMNEKEHTVISFDQQRDIGNYKMKSDYKTPKEEDDIFSFNDISRPKFAVQSIPSKDTLEQNVCNGDVVISDNTNVEEAAGQNSNAAKKGKYKFRKVNLNKNQDLNDVPGFKYQQKFQNYSQTNSRSKKVSLKKNTSVNNYPENSFLPISGYGDENSSVQSNQEGTVVPPGLTKNQLLTLPHLHSIRISYYSAIVILYASLLISLFSSVLGMNLYGLINVLLVLCLTLGMQFKMSYICAIGCLVYGALSTMVNAMLFGNFTGVSVMFAGILAVISIKKFDKLREQYLLTGIIPYEK